MDAPRIAILTPYNEVQCFMDNNVPNAMHYYDDTLHTYLKGSAYTYEFKTLTRHSDTKYLVEGNKLSFFFKDKGYYLTIMTVERGGAETTITAYGLCLELTNEQISDYSGTSMSFVEYLNAWGFEQAFTIGVNEVSDKRISNEWTGSETILARMYSLATVFSAELEFVTELNNDYSLKRTVLNIYRENDDTHHGIGEDRTNEVLRYPKDIQAITKTSDITEIYTAIRPTGTDGLQLNSISGRKVLDDYGNVLYQVNGNNILAPQARDRFPSYSLKETSTDAYTVEIWSYETDSVETLYGQALAELKKHVEPSVSYEVDSYIEANIGDSFTIEDSEYTPTLYLTARITEQEISFTNVSNSKTTFDNFKETQSQIDPSLRIEMEQLIKENTSLDCTISTTNGIMFKSDDDTSDLTAVVKNADSSTNYTLQWYRDGEELSNEKTITVKGSDFESKAVYSFKVLEGLKVRGQAETTCMRIDEGVNAYLHIAYANSADGQVDFSLTDSDRKYIGQYTDSSSYDSDDPTKYRWSAFKGADAQSLVDYVQQYYYSDSSTEPTGGEWFEGNIEYQSGKYLWKRYKATYENPSETKYTTPIYDNTWDAVDSKILEVSQVAQSASDKATSASDLATTANDNATTAKSKAEEAETAISSANEKITTLTTDVSTVKTDVQTAVDKVNQDAKDIASIKETYTTKVELTDAKADISTEITKEVGALESKVSETYEAKTDAVTMKGELQTQITQNADNISSHATKIATLETDTSQIETDLATAQKKADEASASATQAQTDVATANEKLTKAQEELDNAKKNLENVTGRVDSAEGDIAQAQKDIETAQTAVEEAQKEAEEAKTQATTTQTNLEQAQKDLAEVQSRVTNAESNITQTAESITASVTTTQTQLTSLVEQLGDISNYKDSDGNTLTMQQVIDNARADISHISSTQLTLDDVGATFMKVDEYANKVDNANDFTVSMKEWVQIVGSTIKLGASTSNYSCQISNTELAFYGENGKVAWISGSDNSLHIGKAIIAESIGCGNYKWVDEGSIGFSLI
jgi:predicted  nucleic acid-binding Zn-ribbon protein